MGSYTYHPDMRVELGCPFDRRQPHVDKTTNNYLTWSAKEFKKSDGASVSFSVEEVASREELFEKLSLDFNIQSKFSLANFGTSLNWEREITFNSESIIFIVQGKKIYNDETISGIPTLSDIGKKALKAVRDRAGMHHFINSIGTEYVTKINKGNLVSLIYQFNCSDRTFKESLKAKLSASWATGHGSIDFKKELYSIDSSLSIKIKGFQSGVSGQLHPMLSDVIKVEPGNITKIREIVSSILSNVSASNRDASKIVSFTTSLISDLPEILQSKYYNEFTHVNSLNNLIDERCRRIDSAYNQLKTERTICEELLSMWTEKDYESESRLKIGDKLAEIDTEIQNILAIFNKVIFAQKVEDLKYKINDVLPLSYGEVLKKPYIVFLSWKCSTSAWEVVRELGTYQTLIWPEIYIKFPRLIKQLRIILNDKPVTSLNRIQIEKVAKEHGSLKEVWRICHESYNVYAWGWRPSEWIPKLPQYESTHRNLERNNSYQIEVTSIDGEVHVIDIGSIETPTKLEELKQEIASSRMSKFLIECSFYQM